MTYFSAYMSKPAPKPDEGPKGPKSGKLGFRFWKILTKNGQKSIAETAFS